MTTTYRPPLSTRRLGFRGVALTLASAAAATAGIRVGEGEINIVNEVQGVYDSNLEGRANGVESYSLRYSPSVSFSRPEALVQSRINGGLTYEHFLTGPFEDRHDWFGDATLAVPAGVFGNYSGSLTASYSEGASANADVGERVSTATTSYRAQGEAPIGTRFFATAAGSFSQSRSVRFANRDQYLGQAGARYVLGERTGLFATYAYRETDASAAAGAGAGLSQTSDTYTLGASRLLTDVIKLSAGAGYTELRRSRSETAFQSPGTSGTNFFAEIDGPFLPPRMFPKLKSAASLSYSTNQSPGINDRGGKQIAGRMSLLWEALERTNLSLSAQRGRELTIDNFTSETTSVDGSVTQVAFTDLRLSGRVGHEWRTIASTTRGSQSWIAGASATQAFGATRAWNASVDFSFRDYQRDDNRNEFDHYVVTMKLRYTY